MKTKNFFILAVFLLALPTLKGETIFYFPHYGDGDGLSMAFTFENPSNISARVNVDIYNSSGNSAQLSFPGYGTFSSFYADLEPMGSITVKTSGTSNPLKVGFVRVQSTNDRVTGVAVFQYSWGGETSILPVKAKRRFVLPFEKNSALDIGLAIYREHLDPVEIKLYNSSGYLIDSVFYDPVSYHSAAFSGEIFGAVPITKGMLILESESPFAPVGLRFGNGVLASLPADEYRETSKYLADLLCEPSGIWLFEMTIISTFEEFYAMAQTVELKPGVSQDVEYRAWGLDEFQNEVVAEWWDGASIKNSMIMLDPGYIFDDVYLFWFTHENRIEGFWYMRDSNTGDLGDPYPLTGSRMSSEDSILMPEKNPMTKTEAKTRERASIESKFKPMIRSGPFKDAVDCLANKLLKN